jgi:hypothetical protein
MLVNDGDLGKCDGDALEAGVDKVPDHHVKRGGHVLAFTTTRWHHSPKRLGSSNI